MVDMLEVANMEFQGVWNQLEGTQRLMEYLTKLMHKMYTNGSEGSSDERGGEVRQGVKTREAV